MIIDDSKLEFVGSVWVVDLAPTSKDSVETTNGFFLE